MLCVLHVDDNYNALMNELTRHLCSLHLYIILSPILFGDHLRISVCFIHLPMTINLDELNEQMNINITDSQI